MKKAVFYGNCQMDGLVYFLRKTSFVKDYDVTIFHNWRLMLNEEETGQQLIDAAKSCDLLLYQPTREFACRDGTLVPSTDDLGASVVSGVRVSKAYQFNHGFFPVVKHGCWKSSAQVADIAGSYLTHPPSQVKDKMFRALNAGTLNFGCAARFIACLAEQTRREIFCSIKMGLWILANCQRVRLFNTTNHPSSALYLAIIREFLSEFEHGRYYDEGEALTYDGPNDANIPMGVYPTSPQAIAELSLEYAADPNAHEYLRERLEELIKEASEGVKVTWQA